MSKSKQQSKNSLLSATYFVIKAAIIGKPDSNYEYQFAERKILHEKSPPHVQAVNQHLDQQNVALEEVHLTHFERGFSIDNHPVSSLEEKGKRHWKTIKNERKLADSFYQEAENELKKEDVDQTKAIYARSGYLSHTLFGSFKATTNPFVAHEEGFEIGATHDYLDNNIK